MSDCTHEWGLDILGFCKGCGQYVGEPEPQPKRGIAADVPLPYDEVEA